MICTVSSLLLFAAVGPAAIAQAPREQNAAGAIRLLPVQGNISMLVGAGANITVQAGDDGILPWIPGNTLVYTSTHLKEAYLTRAGVPRSAKATVTTRITRYGNYLTMVIIIDDPAYLTEPYMREETWVNAPDQVVSPFACEPVAEGTILPAGTVPSYLPGRNDALWEFAIEFGILPDATQRGAETTYPEYIEKMKKMKTLPRTTRTHYLRQR